jgi:peptidoglycan/LPS O-acetylase OafA/YrhL
MRIEQLTFTRFIAAVAVVIFHFGREVFPFQHPILQPLVLSANIGVSYFFILSGFVMIIAYNKQPNIDYKQFYISRIARIFPAFLVSIFLMLIYFFLIGKDVETKNIILQILLIHAWIKEFCLSLNFPSWSLSVEILFYVLFPVLFNFFYKPVKKQRLYSFILLFWIVITNSIHCCSTFCTNSTGK